MESQFEYNLPFPLGEIIYEENKLDKNLEKINENIDFINFVNQFQKRILSGTNN